MKSFQNDGQIQSEKARIESEFGEWTAHNLQLTNDVWTKDPEGSDAWIRRRADWYSLVAQTMLNKPMAQMRVLDIGCLEGGLSLLIGKHADAVIGLEIRDAHLRKAEFARDVLEQSNVSFVKGDMLKLNDHGLGEFDLIICAGTLYHVDAPDLLPFLKALRAACRGVVLFDTLVSRELKETYRAQNGVTYYGRSIIEHLSDNNQDKEKRLWASGDNKYSFWPTERSLVNLLSAAGFGFVSKPLAPALEWNAKDREIWAARSVLQTNGIDVHAKSGRLREPDPRLEQSPLLDRPFQVDVDNPATEKFKG